jgi:DNA-directed RNA polymerase subunit omega
MPEIATLLKGIFSIAIPPFGRTMNDSTLVLKIVNAELAKRAAEKVGNPNVLVNLISRRVRQLNAGGGGLSRPLIDNPGSLGLEDIALREILEDKMGFELPPTAENIRPVPKKRRKH